MPISKPFQLDANNFKVGNMLIDGVIKSAVGSVNKADLNHNGVPDIAEIAPIAAKALPMLVALNEAIDFEQAASFAVELPFVKNKELLKHWLLEAGKMAEDAQRLMPH